MENRGPILSKGESSKDKSRRIIIIILVLFFVAIYSFFTIITVEKADDFDTEETSYTFPLEEENASEKITTVPEKEIIVGVEEETADYYYKRALEKEKIKDYNGAVEDYSKTIELAKKYSSEMWNALNNRGIIKAKQLKDYKGALTDFNQIIKTETNRLDGNMNLTRLESGYTNRAYVKKMKGDKDGACDDLYLALGVSSTSSSAFIEKQIDKNCW
jgi:tetratricopeptide (TPR) repeat protein